MVLRIVFLTQESPLSSEHLDVSQFKNVFNWTSFYAELDAEPALFKYHNETCVNRIPKRLVH